MITKNKAAKKKKTKGRVFERAHFEALVTAKKITFKDLVEMHKKGLIGDHDYVFTLEGLIDVAYETAKGFHSNCRRLGNPKGRWARDIATEDARLFIKKAFT